LYSIHRFAESMGSDLRIDKGIAMHLIIRVSHHLMLLKTYIDAFLCTWDRILFVQLVHTFVMTISSIPNTNM
jgi:hypothetical protein